MAKRSNLEGCLQPDGRYLIRVTVTSPEGIKSRKKFYGQTKAEAQAKAHKFIHEDRRILGSDATVCELANAYRESIQTLKPTTIRSYERSLVLIESAFGSRIADRLTTPQIFQWLQRLELGDRTVDLTRTVFGAMLGYGKLIGTNRVNPLSGVRLKKRSKPEQKRITENEVISVLEFVDISYRPFFYALMDCGLRPWREALHLTREDVGLHADQFFFIVRASKTESGERVVPINDRRVLDHILSVTGSERLWPYTESALKSAWRRARDRACIKADIYSLRRLAITKWCEEKPLDEVKTLAGHKTLALTLEVYNEVQRNRVLGVQGLKKGLKVSEITGP